MRIAAAACLMIVTSIAGTVPGAGPARADADITGACAGNVSQATFTLTANCDTTQPLVVPDGYTVNGGGHEITAHGYQGSVVTNANTSGGGTMTLENLTVRGTGLLCDIGGPPPPPTVGVLFHNASGAMTDVQVLDISSHTTCMYAHAIMIESEPAAGRQTVNITGVTAAGFERTGLLVRGTATVDVTGSTFGPPDLTVTSPGGIAQNSVQIGSGALAGPTGGTFTGNDVIGTGFGATGNSSTGMLLVSTTDLTVSGNTFSGTGTDHGISLWGQQNNLVISRNQIDRSPEDRPGFTDLNGFGVYVRPEDYPQTGTTLICNTFSGWNQNLVRITQPPCVQTTQPPCAIVGEPYSYQLQAINTGGVTLSWQLVSGELPPGLTLDADGLVTGTPDDVGTSDAVVEVTSSDGTDSGTISFCARLPEPPPAEEPPGERPPEQTPPPGSVPPPGFGRPSRPGRRSRLIRPSRLTRHRLPVTG